MADLFPGTKPPRKKPRTLMHAIAAAINAMPKSDDKAFREWWDAQVRRNGAKIGADYRHWAKMGWEAAQKSDDARDAARWRWMRQKIPGHVYRKCGVFYSEGRNGIDEAIDAAMKAEG
jgi:hypothetical protein